MPVFVEATHDEAGAELAGDLRVEGVAELHRPILVDVATQLGAGTTYTLTIPNNSGCTIDSRSSARADMANQCSQGAFDTSSGCHKMFFTPNFVPDRFKVLISCGGVRCPDGAPCPS